jgi:tetratricopeptide (TPR) repeat protein
MLLNNQADAELDRGDLPTAERLYREALAAARSIEDDERVAVNLLGLAATLRAAGRGGEAGALLDEMVEGPAGRFPPDLVAQASLQKAVIALDEGRPSDAAAAARRSLASCAGHRPCRDDATAHVLLARAALAQGAPAAAAEAATAGLDAARAHRDLREEANARRLLGDAALAVGNGDTALSHYRDALVVDKALGLPGKVAADLLGLAAAAHRLGRTADARAYAERALAAATAAGDGPRAAAARELGAAGPAPASDPQRP